MTPLGAFLVNDNTYFPEVEFYVDLVGSYGLWIAKGASEVLLANCVEFFFQTFVLAASIGSFIYGKLFRLFTV